MLTAVNVQWQTVWCLTMNLEDDLKQWFVERCLEANRRMIEYKDQSKYLEAAQAEAQREAYHQGLLYIQRKYQEVRK